MEYNVWQATDGYAKIRALQEKLWYQLQFDTNFAAVESSFERLEIGGLALDQRVVLAKNKAIFYYRHEAWEAAAASFYDYLSLVALPDLIDSMQYYYLNRKAMGDFSASSIWTLFELDSSRQDCIACLSAVLSPITPSKWPKIINYVVPGSGMIATGHWREGLGSMTLNAIGITGAVVMLSASLPVNTFVWAVSWEVLFYPGSQRALAKFQFENELQKKADLNLECQARWEKWLQSLQYEPFT